MFGDIKMKDEVFLKPTIKFAAIIVFTLMLGVVDWASGYELQFFVFYFIPIAAVAWTFNLERTNFIAVFSALTWCVADLCTGHTYSSIGYAIWNTAIRLISFLLLGYSLSRIKDLLAAERKISADLQKALDEVKTLKGLLPVCAWCRKIRNDDGYWQQMEDYIETHSSAQFTHGLCQECASKILKDAGLNLSDIESKADGTGKISL
jgi:hypothetical protein